MIRLIVMTVMAVALTATPAQALISAHRGTFRNPNVPENTMEAFEFAHRHGADAIEFDVRWTKDQKKYVLHDDTFGRTTDGTGRLEDHSSAYLRSLTVDGGGKIPSFRKVTEFAKQTGMQINPEIKPVAGKPLTDAQAKSYVAIVYMFGMGKRTVLSSISPAILAKVKKYDTRRELRYSLIQIPGQPLHPPATVAAAGKVYMPLYTDLTPAYVTALHARGVEIWAWPIRNDEDKQKALALNVDVLVVDTP
jgi:glycerophosphoryl diester phosphodiesterase